MRSVGIAFVTRRPGGAVLMRLTRRTRGGPLHGRKGLDEDLRYGPDITTIATVPADAVTTAALVSRADGVAAGIDIALLTLDEVLGADGYRVLGRADDGDRLRRGDALLTLSRYPRAADC